MSSRSIASRRISYKDVTYTVKQTPTSAVGFGICEDRERNCIKLLTCTQPKPKKSHNLAAVIIDPHFPPPMTVSVKMEGRNGKNIRNIFGRNTKNIDTTCRDDPQSRLFIWSIRWGGEIGNSFGDIFGRKLEKISMKSRDATPSMILTDVSQAVRKTEDDCRNSPKKTERILWCQPHRGKFRHCSPYLHEDFAPIHLKFMFSTILKFTFQND